MFVWDTWRFAQTPTNTEIMFYLAYGIESIFSTKKFQRGSENKVICDNID